MSAVALISGVLYKAPEQKTSKNGNQFVSVTLKARDGDGFQYWRLTAFNQDAQTELMRLSANDAVSVQGLLRAELYKPEGGEPRVSLSLVVDQALAARPKPRKPKQNYSSSPRVSPAIYGEQELNDPLPSWG